MPLPSWEPHWDAWLLVLVVEGTYLWAIRRVGPRFTRMDEAPASRRRIAFFSAGVFALWLASDWPIHDLAEHYLYSMHMVQHMLISLIAPPLLMLGMPEWLTRLVIRPRPINWVAKNLTRPFYALVIFNAVIILSHWPAVVDGTLVHHNFHFLAHVIIFGASLLMWSPVIAPLPEMPTLSYPARMLYLFLQSILPTVPASFLTFGSTPLYYFYTTVPRIWPISVLTDQLVAGLLMKIGGGFILWTAVGVIFFKWFMLERGPEGWDALEWRDVERDVHAQLAKPVPPAEVGRR